MKKLIFCGAVILSAVALDASQPVRVRVSPQISMAPADVLSTSRLNEAPTIACSE